MVAVQKKPAAAKEGGGGSHGIPEGELLGTLALVGLIYFTAAGGAYGRYNGESEEESTEVSAKKEA